MSGDPRRGARQPSASARAVAGQQRGRDPFADYEQEWQMRFSWGDVLGLEDGVAVLVGRDPDSPVAKYCDGNISRHHVEISQRDGIVHVTDLGSTNGTFINGERLEPASAMLCTAGDIIQLASGSTRAPALTFEIVRSS